MFRLRDSSSPTGKHPKLGKLISSFCSGPSWLIFFPDNGLGFFSGNLEGIRLNPRRCPSSPVADAQRICWMSPVGRSPSRHCNPFWHLFFWWARQGTTTWRHFYKSYKSIEMVGAQIIVYFYLNTRSRWEQATCSFQRLAFGMIQIWVMFFRERKSVLPGMGGFMAPSCWFGILVSGTWNSWACFHLGCHLNRKPLGYSKHL